MSIPRSCASALVVLALSAGPASAADGDQLRTFDSANPQDCDVQVGIAFDGTHLLESCLHAPGIDVLNPTDGSSVRVVNIAGAKGFAALAWDDGRKRLWACNAPSGNSPGLNADVHLIDLVGATSTKMFTSFNCHDGLAYDASDDTLWMGADESDDIYHYRTDGKLIRQFSGVRAKLGGHGKSGIAVGGSSLYVANDGGSQIHSITKDFSSSRLFATFPSRLEDLECDNVTFPLKTAIWSIDAFDRHVNAWEITAGSCNFGGGTPPPRPTPPAFGKDGVFDVPSNKRCRSRRNFRIRLRQPKGIALVSAQVFVNGKRVKVVRAERITAPVDLRGLPKGRYTVKITAKTSTGKTIKGTRRYRTCVPKRRT
jgi:hypothetical protein